MFALVAMERPSNISDPSSITDEKARVLLSVSPFTPDTSVAGQYHNYQEEPNIAKDSNTETFFATVIYPNTERWRGVPFVLKAAKALNEKLVEIRISFKNNFQNQNQNQLVFKVQPNESVYFENIVVKSPGLSDHSAGVPLLFSYKNTFPNVTIPDAYAKLYLDVVKGNQFNFVRDDELIASWEIVNPYLKYLKEKNVKPVSYQFGSKGPEYNHLIKENQNKQIFQTEDILN
eukprot:TRINITY_DN2121_c0_g1_i1.p1 TRINITY_DN2121_c0_g1~~TRINITY_DN2121_c0_g1_i1.p1  ORF type:complete len:232 (+),score=70.64 TRINITY_DN2121_c0_g1_i1:829-1524(+)